MPVGRKSQKETEENEAFSYWYWDLTKWNPEFDYTDASVHFSNQEILPTEPSLPQATDICLLCGLRIYKGNNDAWFADAKMSSVICRNDGGIVYAHVADRYAVPS